MAERFMVDDAGTLIDMETRDTYDYVSEVCPVLNKQEERIRELENENKQLKAQLEKGGDVCSICKYEYLVASTEYYIAQCKKGHDECSKGDVDYCKDFELKGDVE